MWVRGGISVLLACLFACSDPQPVTSNQDPVSVREGGTETPSRLVFTSPPFWSERETRERLLPVAEYVGRQVGLPVEWRWYGSFERTIDAVVRHEAHLSVLSPFIYVQAKRNNPALVLLASPVAEGAVTYSGYILVRDDAPFATVEDLQGKRFAYVDALSTSGYLLPRGLLASLGHDPDRFFGSTRFAGSHEAVLRMVLAGEVDAGASYSSMLRTPDARRLKILAKTGRTPWDAWCASPRLEQSLIDAMRKALLGLSIRTKEGRAVLTVSKANGFREVRDEHYDEVRRIHRLTRGAANGE